MEKVPQIRLFGTTQSWKHNPSNYQKKYTDTSSSGIQSFSYESRPTFIRSMQRSNSVSQLSCSNKPSHSNYYQNAIRICEQNQVLGNIKGHYANSFVSSYISTNHNHHHPKKPCTLCQAQAITKNLNHLRQTQQIPVQNRSFQQATKMNSSQQSVDFSPDFYRSSSQQVFQEIKMTQMQSKNNEEIQIKEKDSINKKNLVFFEQASVDVSKPSLKVVSFQEITNTLTPFRVSQENLLLDQVKNLNTQRNQHNSHSAIQFKSQNLEKTKNQPASKNPLIQNFLLPEISQLILQLSIDDIQTFSTTDMLVELEEMTSKHLQKRKSCIEKLDFILQNCGNQTNFDSSQKSKHSLSFLDFRPNQSQLSDGVLSQSSSRRNKIF